ncbi:carbonic anhydrase [Paenibacillus sp. L3-i20]|uniref:carbonic anhydrase n=1 Tax=Paenibacillus sp. L3-i20 TaxID=2905833 RepID=UPI001EDEA66D|nr:carbonic anhydrase family protein [Paenibacillus sp. L3-i20]GKU78517.1 carbonic anhydrase [Paenibacillus sp. L3-i20]
MPSRLTKTLLGAIILVMSASAIVYAEPSAHTEKAAEGTSPHWSYMGDSGTEHWGHLGPDYAACNVGKEQSPINIDTDEKNESDSKEKVAVNYKSTAFTFGNNGHTIQANATATANELTISGTAYTLAQFHFHTPSEHEIDGKASPLELHLVHKSKTGSLAVLGVLIKEGKANTAVTEMWCKLPKIKTDADITLKTAIDLKKLLPKDLDAYRYQGSLTTPPCSEGVKWTVLVKPIEMSKAQIQAFQAIFPDNHRPAQPQFNRGVNETEIKH